MQFVFSDVHSSFALNMQPLVNANENAICVKEEPSSTSSSGTSHCPSNATPNKEEMRISKEEDHYRDEDNADIREKGKSDAEIIRELKSQLK